MYVVIQVKKKTEKFTWFFAASINSQANFSGKWIFRCLSLAASMSHFIAKNRDLLSDIGTGTLEIRKRI